MLNRLGATSLLQWPAPANRDDELNALLPGAQ